MIRPDANGVIDVKAFVAKHRGGDVAGVEVVATEATTSATQTTLVVPSKSDNNGYTEQTVSSLPLYIATNVPKVMEVLGATTADDLGCFEMGDGNLNLVFIVSNKKTNDDGTVRKVIVKQALPYVRCVGESWPLTLDRAYFEYTALEAEKKACPEFVPDLYHFCKQDALIVMQYLAPPIQILRKGLIQGIRYSTMAADMGIFCAKTLFRTSGFCLSTTELRARVEFWSRNSEMCALTEQVVFTEPYIAADNNRWTSPQLDADKKAIEADAALKSAAAAWKIKFVTQTETLIHADLHTGSVMCGEAQDQHQTYVIDPEFAFYGPAAFDTGAFVANLFLSYVSQEGHRGGDDYADWVLDQISTFWTTFETQFIALWNDPTEHTGFVHGRAVSAGVDNNNFQACQDAYMTTLLADTLGFAGMKMLRRIVGIAHVEDLESIEDADVRAKCERRGLAIAQAFIQSSASFKTIEDAIQFARDTKAPSSSASAM